MAACLHYARCWPPGPSKPHASLHACGCLHGIETALGYAIHQGASLMAALPAGPDGKWIVAVQPAAWQLHGPCTLQANVSFATGVLSSAPATVQVTAAVGTLVYALPPDTIALPSTDSASMSSWLLAPGIPLELMKCDWRNYEAVRAEEGRLPGGRRCTSDLTERQSPRSGRVAPRHDGPNRTIS